MLSRWRHGIAHLSQEPRRDGLKHFGAMLTSDDMLAADADVLRLLPPSDGTAIRGAIGEMK